MSANCDSASMPRIRAPYPYFNAVIHERMKACGIPIPDGLPETGRGRWSPSVEAAVDSAPVPSTSRTKISNFFAESSYVKSLHNKCAGLQLPWKRWFSRSNRHIWMETLKYVVRELLEDEKAATDKSIDDEGVDRFVEIVESTIFHYVARDPAEYGNSMAAKFDSIRGGDFSKEERLLLQQLAWL